MSISTGLWQLVLECVYSACVTMTWSLSHGTRLSEERRGNRTRWYRPFPPRPHLPPTQEKLPFLKQAGSLCSQRSAESPMWILNTSMCVTWSGDCETDTEDIPLHKLYILYNELTRQALLRFAKIVGGLLRIIFLPFTWGSYKFGTKGRVYKPAIHWILTF